MAKIIVLSGIPNKVRHLARGLAESHGASAVRLDGPLQAGMRTAGRGPGGAGTSSPEDAIARAISLHASPDRAVVVAYGAATAAVIDRIRKRYPAGTVHVHLTHLTAWQRRRLARRGALPPPRPGHRAAAAYGETVEQRRLESGADAVIGTARCTDQDVLVRAAAAALPRRRARFGYVDVLVGAQYGSEGVGHVAAYLAGEYDLLVRAGGETGARSRVPGDPPYDHRYLPSGTLKSSAQLLLGPGAVLDAEGLLREIAECGVDCRRLSIDPQAAVVDGAGGGSKSSGRRGAGRAAAGNRRAPRAVGARQAGDVTELAPYVRPAMDVVQDVLSRRGRIMLEGTWGAGQGPVRSSGQRAAHLGATASGCMADAGIAPSLVRRVVMVAGTHPVMAGDAAPPGAEPGPLPGETDAATVSLRSGKDLAAIEEAEGSAAAEGNWRIGEFDWSMLQRAADLSRPTDVALTSADYVAAENGRARRIEQLTPDTVEMVEEIERVAGAPVSLVTTGFGLRRVIDRRRW